MFCVRSYDSGKLSDGDGAAARGHITNYALNRDGEVWTLPMLREHLGGFAAAKRSTRTI